MMALTTIDRLKRRHQRERQKLVADGIWQARRIAELSAFVQRWLRDRPLDHRDGCQCKFCREAIRLVGVQIAQPTTLGD